MLKPLMFVFVVLSCLLQCIEASLVVDKRQNPYLNANYNFLGCWRSTLTPPLPEKPVTAFDQKMTLERCAVACSSYVYFGITKGTECSCGTGIFDSDSVVSDLCSSQCSGLGANTVIWTCGGPSSAGTTYTSIFSKKELDVIPPLPGTITQSYNSGCYTKENSGQLYAVSGFVSVERCQVICRGYKLFGVFAQSDQCLCYDELNNRKVPAEMCNNVCFGDNQACGGTNVQTVYSVEAACSNVDQQLLVKNPGFEGGTAYWNINLQVGPISWAARTDANAIQGRFARIDSKAVGSYMVLAQNINLCPGIEYEVSWMGKEGANSGCATWATVLRSTRLGQQSDTQSWVLHASTFYAPSAVTELSIIMQCDGQGSGGFRKLYLDNFQVQSNVRQTQ